MIKFKYLLTPIAIINVKKNLSMGLSYIGYRKVYIFGICVEVIQITKPW